MARRNNRWLRRDEIFEWICIYAEEHNGVTPSIRAVARQFGIAYMTARAHVLELLAERRLRIEDNQLIVEDSTWIPPDTLQIRAFPN